MPQMVQDLLYCGPGREMRLDRLLPVICLTAGLAACGRSRNDSENRDRDERDRKSAAFKLGEASHELSKEAGKAAKAAGRELGKEARQVHDGWNQAKHDEQAKQKNGEH
jgi:uncharacterized protein HemX